MTSLPTTTVARWEWENTPRWRRITRRIDEVAGKPLRALSIAAVAYLVGVWVTTDPEAIGRRLELQRQLSSAEFALQARKGEMELVRLEMSRLHTVMENSRRYRIPADLSAEIYDLAIAEGIDPKVAYSLVRVESGFYPKAVSNVGAVGLTQLMPSTAFQMDPTLDYEDLFDRKTNLRLGFRYLKGLVRKYDGDLRMALLAYNRGPVTVDRVLREGGNPENGFTRMVLDRR